MNSKKMWICLLQLIIIAICCFPDNFFKGLDKNAAIAILSITTLGVFFADYYNNRKKNKR